MRRSFPFLASMILLWIMAAPLSEAAVRANGSVAGTVMTSEGRGLLGAVVALFRQDGNSSVVSFTKSDQHGAYSLNDIAPGSYALQVSRLGYQVLNSPRVNIGAGKITTINFVLQEFFDFISASNDPRNWNLKTVVRSTSDRRLIFRGLPGAAASESGTNVFHRSATLNVASSALLSGENYSVYPDQGDAGIASNFAFSEPVSQHGRMIFSGRLTSGYDSLWRVRDTFHYRPDPDRDYKFSVGYGRLSLNSLSTATLARPAEFFNQDPALRDSGVETLAMGFEGRDQFLNTFALQYGLDLSRINYGATRSILSPYFELAITPYRNWLIRTLMTSRRISNENLVELPDGNVVNLLEPTSISKINNEIYISQIRHSELSLARKFDDDTSVEVSAYTDRTNGPGTPFLMTVYGRNGRKSCASQLRSDQDEQKGFRVAFTRMLIDTVRGSVTYDYGTASGLAGTDAQLSSDVLANHLLDFIQRSYYHSLTSQLEAKIPVTRTHLQATMRWYPGNPISPIDLFGDRTDTFSKGMSFSLRQVLPLPEFMGCPGRWEALIDVRNPFDQGMNRIPTSDGEILLTRNPRTLRFGINLNFF